MPASLARVKIDSDCIFVRRTRIVSKYCFRCDIESELPQSRCQYHSQAMHALGNPPQALRPVVDRIHACHDGQEHLRRANVARRLLTPDVLFAGLQRKPVGRLPRDIFGHANNASRHLPLECLSGR